MLPGSHPLFHFLRSSVYGWKGYDARSLGCPAGFFLTARIIDGAVHQTAGPSHEQAAQLALN
jgi:hypothetical protein